MVLAREVFIQAILFSILARSLMKICQGSQVRRQDVVKGGRDFLAGEPATP